MREPCRNRCLAYFYPHLPAGLQRFNPRNGVVNAVARSIVDPKFVYPTSYTVAITEVPAFETVYAALYALLARLIPQFDPPRLNGTRAILEDESHYLVLLPIGAIGYLWRRGRSFCSLALRRNCKGRNI
jgi:hypothetical protein